MEPGHEVLLVRDDTRPFALVGRWAGGGALVGSEPERIAGEDEDPFGLLAEEWPALDLEVPSPAAHADDGTGPFVGGGWFGHLGFGLATPGEDAISPPPVRERIPPSSLARYDHLLRLDRNGQWWFEALWTAEREPILKLRLEALSARLRDGVARPASFSTTAWRSDPSPVGHARAVRACRERIKAGDLYQANIALRLRSTLRGQPADLFAQAAGALRPDRAAYFAAGRSTIASLSPELFLERRGDRVRSAPIKGTRRRPPDAAASSAALAELAGAEKDRAENVMIVDLVRNDLGRVCIPGSVEVTTLAEAREHPGVWHLVSEVEGTLRPGVDDATLLAAAFPPGSVTGAPKRAALETIAELESAARQVFTGAIGFVSPCAGLEMSVAIRTFELSDDRIWLDVGGGIVTDSDPESEATEALVKARPLLDAIGATLDADPLAASAPAVRRLGPRPVSRPDPSDGVFETLRIEDGCPVELDRHLARLESSVSQLFGASLPQGLAERITEQTAATAHSPDYGSDLGSGHRPDFGSGQAPGRLRVSYIPGRDTRPVDLRTELFPLPADPGVVSLAPVTVPGGLGPHKWRDRRLLDALAEAVAPVTPLLVDLDGHILEAAWANIFIVTGNGETVTPPLDGRILPGVGRELTILLHQEESDPVAERPITLDELRAAREIFLVNSLRGSLPAALG